MKILVCGGAGFIGSTFIRNFLKNNIDSKITNLDALTIGSNLASSKDLENNQNYNFIKDDIRKNSPTYGKWVSEILSDNIHNLLYVPEGFAHGFCVMSDEAHVLYKVSSEYSQEHERSIIWNDPKLDIHWPIKTPII